MGVVNAVTGTPSAMASRNKDHPLETWMVRIRGRVQGVGYRYACVDHARALGIKGWVRNRSDASVQALLQGAPTTLAAMCDWLCSGVAAAIVDELEVSVIEPPFQRFDDFDRWPTL